MCEAVSLVGAPVVHGFVFCGSIAEIAGAPGFATTAAVAVTRSAGAIADPQADAFK